MILLRLLIIAFNVVVVTYLVHRLFMVIQEPIVPWKKTLVIVAGLILLFSPVGMFIGVFRPGMQYFLLYPVGLLIFLYLIREVK